ncbi:MAG: hypothetical protein RLO21_21065, partial [Nitratireductor sp.]
MASVELRSVEKSFGSVEVLHDINLSLEKGEFIVFVGPSGCGKKISVPGSGHSSMQPVTRSRFA